MEERRIYVGQVTKEEAKEVEYAIERLNALKELRMIVTNKELSTTIEGEIAQLESTCDLWWRKTSEVYGWRSQSQFDWELVFPDNKVWLIEKKE